MKKIFTILSALVICSVLFTACGEDKPVAPSVRIGMIRHLNASEEEFNNFSKQISNKLSLNLTSYDPVFYDNLNAMLMALDSGEIKVISTYDCVAQYITEHNNDYEIINDDTLEFIDAFCFAMREDEKPLQEDINACLEKMNEGTLANLVKLYITDVKNEDPPVVEIPHFDDADTIKVAVTGDLPPLDLVLADGQPAGFNTALIAEIGKHLHKNIEIVNIDSGARASALSSGRVDLVFWAIVPVSEIIPADADKPAGTILSSPYYRSKIVHLKLRD